MRFLLDENVHQGLLSFLNGLGHDAAVSPKGLTNGAVFAAALAERRVLITHDQDFSAFPPLTSHPGIVWLRILPKEFTQLKAALQRLLTECPTPEALVDQLVLVFPDRHELIPFRAQWIPFTS